MGGVVITAVRFSHCPQLPLCDAFLESLSKHCGHHLSHDVWRVKLTIDCWTLLIMDAVCISSFCMMKRVDWNEARS